MGGAGRGWLAALVLAVLAPVAGADAVRTPLPQLLTEADQVWRLNELGESIEAARQSEALVRAADALREKERWSDAREYYRRAGLLRPWDFEAKLRYAEVLERLGEAEQAKAVAAQVARFAETDRLEEASRRFTQQAAPAPLPTVAELAPAPGEVVFALVATPQTERWLVEALGRRLRDVLGVRVANAGAGFDVGGWNRTGRAQMAKELRRSIPWGDPRLGLTVAGGYSARPERFSDDQVIEVMARLLKRDGQPGELEAFKNQVQEADKVQQWADGPLLARLREANPQPAQGRVVYLALVPVDLYSGTANFLFGSASGDGNYAVVSYHRFAARFTGEPANRARLLDRAGKQVLSSGGFALGVPRCADPGCARSYPRNMAEQDAKGAGLCGECRDGFARVLGHELPADKGGE